jgi:hypothetical protein
VEREEHDTVRRRGVEATPIEALHGVWSTRLWNCIKNAGCQNLGDVTDCTARDLLKLRNFGEVALRELEQFLASCGLGLRPVRDATPCAHRVQRVELYIRQGVVHSSASVFCIACRQMVATLGAHAQGTAIHLRRTNRRGRTRRATRMDPGPKKG